MMLAYAGGPVPGPPQDVKHGSKSDTGPGPSTCNLESARMKPGPYRSGRAFMFLVLLALLVPSIALGAVTITRTSAPEFYIDVGDDIYCQYVSYTVENVGPDPYQEIWVEVSHFTGGSVSVADTETGLVNLGEIAVGESKTAFIFLQATYETPTPQRHTVTVYDGMPPAGLPLTSEVFTLAQVLHTITANANKVETVVTGPTPPVLGGLVTITVNGNSGTIGETPSMAFTAASFPDWPADRYELLATDITLSGGNVAHFTDQLYYVPANSAQTHYVAVYILRAVATSETPTAVSPIVQIRSGTQIKHTTISSLAAIPPISSADNLTILRKSASPEVLPDGGTSTFTLTLSNSGSVDIVINEIIDTLPVSPDITTYVAGTSALDGSPIPDPGIAGQVLTWNGPFTVPSRGTTRLTFNASFPAVDGFYTNSAVAFIGIEQIDTTEDTADNAPATAVVRVGNQPPDAVDDGAGTLINTPVPVDVLANDSDPDGDEISIIGVDAVTAQGGTAIINDNGTPGDPTDDHIVYTPPLGFSGTDTFTYEIGDAYGGTDTATVTVTIPADSDGDGEPDITDVDDDDDGVLDVDEGDGLVDTDGDGVPNSLDIDSDNDGIVDNVEAQADGAYIPAAGIDTDGDGLDDAYDTDNGGTPIVIVDTDGDGTNDLLDLDSDNDNVPDYIEGHDANHDGIADTIATGVDSDDDGLDDAYDTIVRPTEFNEAGSNSPLQDTDGDGARDWRDTDDDDDGLLTVGPEDANGDGDPTNDDGDGDGTPDYLDADSLVDLAVSKIVDVPVAAEGDTITYTITAVNNGPSQATGVTVTDPLPAGVTYLADDGGGSYDSGTGVWDVGTLDVDASASLSIQATVDAGTSGTLITNTVTDVSQDQHDTNITEDDLTASVAISLPTDVDLFITKTVDDQTPAEGQTITFVLSVTNNGPADATGVSLTDLLPTGVTYFADDGGGSYDPETGVWTVVEPLRAGGTDALRITAQVDAGTAGSVITNIITEVLVDQVDSGISDDDLEESITVENETDLVVVKTVDDGTPSEGDVITYTITVTNNGPTTATSVSVTDVLPDGVTYVSDDGGGAYDSATGIWGIGTLMSGEAVALNIQAAVDTGTSGSVITNVVTDVVADQDDSNATEDDPDVDISIDNDTDLAVTKTVDNNSPVVGATITYTITVTNNGPAMATNVSITDPLPEGVTYVSDDGGGSYVSHSGVWSVGTLAAGESAVLNIQVTVDPTSAGSIITNIITDVDLDQDDSNTTSDDLEEDIQIALDTDGDGVEDSVDIDDDDDGILDVDEGDGEIDTDGDGIPDSLDIDSDNDGIVDNVESQEEGEYVPPTGGDSDGDGLDDAYDPDNGGAFIVPVDTDGDGTTDHLDLDSDDDTVPDAIEGHDANHDGIADTTPSGTDGDGDGLDDAYDTVEGPGQDNATGSSSPVQDTDGDGIRDWRDIDDDNDDIPTEDEDANENGDYSDDDHDGDGTPDYLDPDQLEGEILVSKSAWSDHVSTGGTIGYTLTAENSSEVPTEGVTFHDFVPAGFRYVEDSATLRRAGDDGAIGTDDDVETSLNVSGDRPVVFGPVSFGPTEIVLITYLLRPGAGVTPGDHANVVIPYRDDEPIGSAAGTSVEFVYDATFDSNAIIGKVFHDRDGDGWQDPALATDVIIRGGAPTDAFVPGTTTIDTGDGPRPLDGPASLAEGISFGDVPGWSEPGSRIVIEAELPSSDVEDIVVSSAEGSRVVLDAAGRVTTDHIGVVAAGLNGQRLVITRELIPIEPDDGEWVTHTMIVTETDTIKLTDVIEPIRFRSGKSDIDAEYVERLRAVIETLSDKDNVRLHIVGHTDNERLSAGAAGIYGDNYGLGRSRAEEVGRLLASALGLPETAVSSEGRGPDVPVASNDTPEGMALNRRAEVQVWYDELVDREREISSDVFVEPPAEPSGYRLVVTLTNEGQCEEGIASARLATPEGLVVVTDPMGRYHLAGIEDARFDRGRNIAVKVDAAFLPNGTRFTTENPRVMRVSQGVTERVNFGVQLPSGAESGESADITQIPEDYFFMVGVANVTAGRNDVSGSIEPLASDYHYDEEVFVDGRVAFYLKGMIQGRYLVTAQLDTDEDDLDSLLDGLDRTDPKSMFRRLDPDHYYPVYGDDSVTTLDTDTQGKFYVRLDWDESQALWGNYNTGITGTEFARYNRSLYGAKLHYGSVASTETGERRAELIGFASEAQTASAHNEFIATGGSLYYLRHDDIVQGSEKAWVEVRERETTRVVENIVLVRGRDYEIDEIQGRVILTRPLSGVAGQEGPSIVKDTPLDGNRVFLLVDYEYVPGGFEPADATYGGRAKAWLTDAVALGGTYVQEGRGDSEYELKGADLTLTTGGGTYIKTEYAESQARQVSSAFVSGDGGLSFGDKNLAEDEDDMTGQALGVEARVDFGDISHGDYDGALAGWWKQKDAGFSIARLPDGTKITEYGGEGRMLITDVLSVSARGAVSERDGIGTEQTYSLQADYDVTDRWDVGAEIRLKSFEPDDNERTNATLAAARIGYDVTRSLNIYGIGQFTVDKSDGADDNNLGTVGLQGRIGDKLALRAEGSSGDLGTSADIGADYALNDTQTMYGTYTLSTDHTHGESGVFTLGQRRNVSDQLAVFTEHQFAHEDDGARAAQVYGADYEFSEWATVGLSLQSSALESEGTDVERDVATVSASYGHDRTRLGGKLEYRSDTGPSDRTQWLTTNSITHRATEDLVLTGKLSLSQTEEQNTDAELARFVEAGVGFAYRPICGDRFNVLGRYTYLSDLASEAQDTDDGVDERSHIMSLEGMHPFGHRVEMGGKYARKQGDVRFERGAGDWHRTSVDFAAARARYHVTNKWDGLVEYRWLSVKETDDQRQGVLAGAYRQIGDNLRVGVGYNFTDFSDDLTDLSYESHGWFIDLVGSY